MIRVEIEQTGTRRYRKRPEDAVDVARRLLTEHRQAGIRVPRASFFVDGRLVRAGVTRTHIATALGVCWCGRGALRGHPEAGEAFCCAAHEALWQRMSNRTRAAVIVARFVAIYAGVGRR